MNKQWQFLTSTRFWAIVIGAVSVALFQDGYLSQAWATAISVIVGGFTVVRTVDRSVDVKANALKG